MAAVDQLIRDLRKEQNVILAAVELLDDVDEPQPAVWRARQDGEDALELVDHVAQLLVRSGARLRAGSASGATESTGNIADVLTAAATQLAAAGERIGLLPDRLVAARKRVYGTKPSHAVGSDWADAADLLRTAAASLAAGTLALTGYASATQQSAGVSTRNSRSTDLLG